MHISFVNRDNCEFVLWVSLWEHEICLWERELCFCFSTSTKNFLCISHFRSNSRSSWYKFRRMKKCELNWIKIEWSCICVSCRIQNCDNFRKANSVHGRYLLTKHQTFWLERLTNSQNFCVLWVFLRRCANANGNKNINVKGDRVNEFTRINIIKE